MLADFISYISLAKNAASLASSQGADCVWLSGVIVELSHGDSTMKLWALNEAVEASIDGGKPGAFHTQKKLDAHILS